MRFATNTHPRVWPQGEQVLTPSIAPSRLGGLDRLRVAEVRVRALEQILTAP
jgi:hypothetical protein